MLKSYNNNNIVNNFQSAYKAGHCCESALLRVYNDSYCIYIICMIFRFLQCVSTVIIVYIFISPLNSYLYIHWILELK